MSSAWGRFQSLMNTGAWVPPFIEHLTVRVQPLYCVAQACAQDHLALVAAARAIVQVIGLRREAVQCAVAAQVLQPLQQGLFNLVSSEMKLAIDCCSYFAGPVQSSGVTFTGRA